MQLYKDFLLLSSHRIVFYSAVQFGDVDKVESAATSVNDHWHFILRRTEHSGGSLT